MTPSHPADFTPSLRVRMAVSRVLRRMPPCAACFVYEFVKVLTPNWSFSVCDRDTGFVLTSYVVCVCETCSDEELDAHLAEQFAKCWLESAPSEDDRAPCCSGELAAEWMRGVERDAQ